MGVYPLSTPKTHRFSALFCFMGGTMGSYSHFLVYTKSSLVEQTTPVFLTLDEVFWGLQKKGPEDWWQVKTLKTIRKHICLLMIGLDGQAWLLLFFFKLASWFGARFEPQLPTTYREGVSVGSRQAYRELWIVFFSLRMIAVFHHFPSWMQCFWKVYVCKDILYCFIYRYDTHLRIILCIFFSWLFSLQNIKAPTCSFTPHGLCWFLEHSGVSKICHLSNNAKLSFQSLKYTVTGCCIMD